MAKTKNDSMFNLEIDGIEEAIKLLKETPVELRDGVMSAMHRKILNETIKDNLIAAAPSQNIKDAIKTSNTKAYTDNPTSVGISFSTDVFYVRFLEYGAPKGGQGTRYRYLRKNVRGRSRRIGKAGSTGTMEARPFVRDAYYKSEKQVIRFFKLEYVKTLSKIIARKSKGKAKKTR